MKYLNQYKDGDIVQEIYLVKDKKTLETKVGKPYHSLTLQDKTKAVDAKIWDPNSAAIDEYEDGDYVYVLGEMTNFNGTQQIKITRLQKTNKSDVKLSDYMPATDKDVDLMWKELMDIKSTVCNEGIKKLLDHFFDDPRMAQRFKEHSAAKKMHHAFVGGLLEHTLGVTKLCDALCTQYPMLNRDLMIAGGMLHDIGKTVEISSFPENDYTDAGQLLGHIVIGVQMIHQAAVNIPEISKTVEQELSHMILAHHGEYEYGSPKKPALMEALALNLADNADAKMEMFREVLANGKQGDIWHGYSKIFESNIRTTEI